RATQDLDQEALAPLLLPCLLRLLLVRLEDAQPAAFGLGVQPGQGLAQGQGLVLIEAAVLGDHGCPQGKDRHSVDRDGSGSHASSSSTRNCLAPLPLVFPRKSANSPRPGAELGDMKRRALDFPLNNRAWTR